jgi:lysophospholipase L1-like esterase
MRRVLAISAVLLVAYLGTAGFDAVSTAARSARASLGGRALAAPAPLERAPTDVFVVGDSLTVGTKPWLATEAAALGVHLTGVDARSGRPTAEGLAVLRREAPTLPGTVILALGTNDLGAPPEEVAGWLREARLLVGERRLIWVNLSLDPSRRVDLAPYRDINAALAANAGQFGIELADWDAWSRAHGIDTGGDGIHYDAPSYRQRARFYVDAASRPLAGSH